MLSRKIVVAVLALLAFNNFAFAGEKVAGEKTPAWDKQGYDIPIVDLNDCVEMQSVVDKEKGQYLGHPTTYLMKDGMTLICVYPKGHGKGHVQMKMSKDGGKTWGERLPTPESWKSSKEVPTLYATIDADDKERVLMVTGAQPGQLKNMPYGNRIAYSEDDGLTWGELIPVKNQETGGVVAYSDMKPLNTGKGHYIASYHIEKHGVKDEQGTFRSCDLFVVFTEDGGVTWTAPQLIFSGTRDKFLCEAGIVKSPDGKTLALLLRENNRLSNSQIMFSQDEGKTWSEPKPMPGSLNGDRHQAIYFPDGRLFIQFRDITPRNREDNKKSPTEGDWAGWVGTWDDLVNGYEGQFRVRLKDNCNGWDTAYPAVAMTNDGFINCVTYGHFDPQHNTAYVMDVRFKPVDLDNRYNEILKNGQPKLFNNMGEKGDSFIFDPNDPDAINRKAETKE